ncbi:hypothetical protein [Virgisporangium aliadipatigenens]|uniref:hypothetical protein n=1 Tax=Virgisporangium aliadipatigenens TaxID=741659 RepID=UPI001941221A|nr:hypothetical protein [Virgisporangium aliadipatigenens]
MFRLSDRVAAVTYVVLVLGMSLGTATVLDGLVLAFSPVLVALLMMLAVTREGWSGAGWHRVGITRPGLRTWPLAVGTTAGVCVLATAAVVALGAARPVTPDGPWLREPNRDAS